MESLRGLIESRVARLRALGWRGLIEIERDTLRRLMKATVAATLAYEVSALLNSPRPVLASLGAILVIQVTVRASLTRSIQLTIGVTVGLVGAVSAGHFFGVHWWSVALIVLAGLLAGEILRLGVLAPQAAISALLALSLGSAYGVLRAEDTAIGAVIGVLVNALIAPPTYVAQASDELRRVAEDVAALMRDLAAGLPTRPSRATVMRWVARARLVSGDIRNAAATVAQGEESLRFNPRAHQELSGLMRLDEARKALEHVGSQVRGIARAALDLVDVDERTKSAPVADSAAVFTGLGPMLQAAAGAVVAFGRLQRDPHAEAERAVARRRRVEARAHRDEVAQALATLPATDERVRLLGAMLVDVERLVREVDIDDGAHAAAVTVP